MTTLEATLNQKRAERVTDAGTRADYSARILRLKREIAEAERDARGREERGAAATTTRTNTPTQREARAYDVTGTVVRTVGVPTTQPQRLLVHADTPEQAVEEFAIAQHVYGWQVISVESVTLPPPTEFQRAWMRAPHEEQV